MALRPGELDRRLRFEQRGLDANGERRAAWDASGGVTVAGRVRFLRGSEAVVAQRLEGRQPATLLVRNSSAVAPIGNAWRAVDVLSGQIFEIVSPPALTPDRAAVEFMAEAQRVAS